MSVSAKTLRCVPMIHVPDVRATAAWYESIGFTLLQTAGGEGGGLSFARLAYGTSEVMFNIGGTESDARRREVDLYVYAENVDALHATLKDRVDVVEEPHDTVYGMRELIVRDLNRFWITFGEPGAAPQLLQAIAEGNLEAARSALRRPGVTGDLLAVALAKATSGAHRDDALVAALEAAGAVPRVSIPSEVLHGHTGTYEREDGSRVEVLVRDGVLRVFTEDGFGAHLVPIDDSTFRSLEFGTSTVTFGREPRGTGIMTFSHGAHHERHTRVEDPNGTRR